MSVRYPKEFKKRALGLYYDEGMTCQAIANQINVPYETVRTWVRKSKAEQHSPEAETEAPTHAELLAANTELAKKLREAQKVIEVLKASTAFFASEIDQTRRTW